MPRADEPPAAWARVGQAASASPSRSATSRAAAATPLGTWRATFTTPTGRTVPLHGVHVIETANGKFQHVRAYYDPQELDRES